MYSDNDFRNYSELYHASAFGKGGFINGKNTPEYNKWYYMTHPEKWGITKAAQNAGKKLEEMAKNTETDLDDRFLDAAGNLINKGKNAVANNSVVKDVRKSTEAMQRRDDANRSASKHRAQQQEYQSKADRASANARAVANNPYVSPSAQAEYNRQAKMYNQAAAGSGRLASNYERTANINDSASRGYANRAINRVKNNVTDTVSRATDSVGNAFKGAASAVGNAAKGVGTRVSNAVNDAINRSDTLADNFARDAVRSLGRGDFRNAANFAGQAAKTVGRDIGNTKAGTAVRNKATEVRNNAINAAGVVRNTAQNAGGVVRNTAQNVGGLAKNTLNNAIDRSKTDVDNKLRDVYRAYRSGDEGAVKDAWKRAGDQTIRELNPVINTGYRVANKIADATGLTARRQAQSAREHAEDLSNQANAYRKSANESGRDRVTARNTGDINGMRSAAEDEISKNREAEVLERRAGAAEYTADAKQRAYDRTPLGKVESAAKAVKEAISDTYNKATTKVGEAVEGAKNSATNTATRVGESVEAKKAAVEAISDAFDDYYTIVQRFGPGSNQAKAALKKLSSDLNSSEARLFNKFSDSEGTIASVMEFGQEWIDNLLNKNSGLGGGPGR